MNNKVKILLTAIGKRVQLVQCLKKHCTVIGVDAGDTAPAIDFVDRFYKIPRCNEDNYIDALLDICRKENIDFLIPLYEPEFETLCDNREKFREIGTTLLLSSKAVIDICQNKLKTYEFFKKNNIGTPITFSSEEILDMLNHREDCSIGKLQFPLIIKPVDGMGSAQVFKVNNKRQLEFFIDYVENPMVQEFVEGTEYTIDVLCDLNGNIISIVPRERIEVRSGEVSKSKTVKHMEIINETSRLIQWLKQTKDEIEKLIKFQNKSYVSNIVGPYTIQCKVTPENKIKFIEINPRFGGGVPLTFEAGVDYGKYFDLMAKGKNIEPVNDSFKEITMLRYDEAVYVK